jgi:thioredoxin reductase (NADPH)
MKDQHYKSIIIGGGPGGSSTAIYLARFNHEVLLLDAPDKIPSRTAWALNLENVLGFTKPRPGPEFLKDVRHQLQRFQIERREELVTDVKRDATGGFLVMTSKPAQYHATYVILAVGVHDIMPDVPHLDDYFGQSIFQCPTCNWYQTKDQKTGIISNDDSGIKTALGFNVMQAGSASYVLPDRPNPSFSQTMITKAKIYNISVFEFPLISLKGKNGKLESIMLADETILDVEILYSKLGVKRHDTFLDMETANVDRDEDGYITVNFETLETSVVNLFAVGPCNTGPDQVMVAAGQGVSAAMEIHRRILTEKSI